MDDLISREAVLDYLTMIPIDLGYREIEDVERFVQELPSAHPELDEWCTDCKEYDQERHCCPRFNRVIRETLAEISITRCKDCKHWKVSQNNTCGIQICYLFGGVREEYDFCSRGEKA